MNLSVGDIINTIKAYFNTELPKNTEDTLKTGDISMEVTGIVTTFMATVEVIKKSIDIGANMIITHEPTFYNGPDDVSHLLDCDLYNYKRNLLEDNNIAVLRIHDYLHKCTPDGIVYGVAAKLGWNSFADAGDKYIFNIPETKLSDLIEGLKTGLNVQMTRYVGKLEMNCKRIGLLVGASGGKKQIRYLDKENIDVLVCGEATEWEAVEYVRDAVSIGANKAIIILGHACSEEPGMEYMADWLKYLLPEMPITFIPAGNPLSYI